jgi:hypothetical protein
MRRDMAAKRWRARLERRRRTGPGRAVTRHDVEHLEPRLVLAAGGVVRPLLTNAAAVSIDASLIGPAAIVFGAADLIGEQAGSVVVTHVAHGTVEKYDSLADRWIDVAQRPAGATPQELLKHLADRVIDRGDRLRWRPELNNPTARQQAFEIIGWNDGQAFMPVERTVPARGVLPSQYDLRDHGWVTPPENQGDPGTCWAFSLTTVYQSSLLKQGFVTDVASPALDLSILHMATHNGAKADLEYPYNDWGGFTYRAVGYWTRGEGEWQLPERVLSIGGGAVMESANPLNMYPLSAIFAQEDLSPYVPPTQQSLAPYRVVRSIEFFPPDGTDASDVSYRQVIKQAVLDYGALSAAMHLDGESMNWDSLVHRYTGDAVINHAVTLVGWDDSKLVEVNGVTSTGAWLIQNSWGPHWGEGGYFWVAYDDSTMMREATALVVMPNDRFDPVTVQNQIFLADVGIDPDFGFERHLVEAEQVASKLESPDDATLLALGLFAWTSDESLDVAIYDDWGPHGPLGQPLIEIPNVVFPTIGYIELTLPNELLLRANDAVYVVVDFGEGDVTPLTIDQESLQLLGMGSFAGLSWMSNDGVSWTDLADNGAASGVYFVKGFTAA